MTVSVISFTENGERLSCRLAEQCVDFSVERYSKRKRCEKSEDAAGSVYVKESLTDWVREQFEKKNALLFIGACGIAVRAIAPILKDKCTDSPVLVMDEGGKYVIPILSGHIGGANGLANEIAEQMKAVPVITTATDLNRRFAVDVFAKKNGLWIRNREGIVQVSAKILQGEEITISVGEEHCKVTGTLPEFVRLVPFPPSVETDVVITEKEEMYAAKLLLTPKEYVLGIGCRKGTTKEQLLAFVTEQLEQLGISFSQICEIASIDLKKEEEGLKQFALHAGIPFVTYSTEELAAVEGMFCESEFVRRTVGIGNVCERAALRACGAGGQLALEKRAQDGMTLAVARRTWEVTFDGC